MTSAMRVVWELARSLGPRNEHLSGRELARVLNAAGLRTTSGQPYRGLRGTYRLVRATYDRLVQSGQSADASLVARTFTLPNGLYAY